MGKLFIDAMRSLRSRRLHPVDESGACANDHMAFVDHVTVGHELVTGPEHSSWTEGKSQARQGGMFRCWKQYTEGRMSPGQRKGSWPAARGNRRLLSSRCTSRGAEQAHAQSVKFCN
jgi:hypothetical protein